jgi:hypothetical protein
MRNEPFFSRRPVLLNLQSFSPLFLSNLEYFF